MKKGFLTSLIVMIGLGTSGVVANAATVKKTTSFNKSSVMKSKKTKSNHSMKGVDSKKYYTKFKYRGLIDNLKHEDKSEKMIQATTKIMGNWHWVEVINANGALAYTSPHFSKANEVKKADYTPSESIVQIEHDSAGYTTGYKFKSPVPVVEIIRVGHHTVFKTFDGVYISANRNDVRELNYYHQKN